MDNADDDIEASDDSDEDPDRSGNINEYEIEPTIAHSFGPPRRRRYNERAEDRFSRDDLVT